jgi:hypothetical protein
MVKIFLTIVFNSNESFNYSILENIIKKFMTPKKFDFYNDYNNNYGDNDEEDPEREKKEQENNKKKEVESTRNCIETLLKIIDVGLDKSYEDFMQDIDMISQPIVKMTENFNMLANIEMKINPITEYRYFLKPQFYEKKKISTEDDRDGIIALMNKSDHLNLYEQYKTMFQDTFNNYFKAARFRFMLC